MVGLRYEREREFVQSRGAVDGEAHVVGEHVFDGGGEGLGGMSLSQRVHGVGRVRKDGGLLNYLASDDHVLGDLLDGASVFILTRDACGNGAMSRVIVSDAVLFVRKANSLAYFKSLIRNFI